MAKKQIKTESKAVKSEWQKKTENVKKKMPNQKKRKNFHVNEMSSEYRNGCKDAHKISVEYA